MNNNTNTEESLKELVEKIKDIKVAMMSTIDSEGYIRSRPMQTQETKLNGEIWFFTSVNSHKILELNKDSHVNLNYASPDDNLYVSVSGKATLIKDQAKIDELWTPFMKAWFPEGKQDPNVGLIKVTIEKAEYWDSPSSTVVQLYGMAKAALTGESPDLGEHKKINL